MTCVLAFAMQKGGVGKTTTALSLGVALARRGARALLVDLDPQANLTQGLGVDPAAVEYSIYEVLLNPDQGAGFAVLTTAFGVDLIPASSRDIFGCSKNRQNRIVENSTYPLDDFGFR